MYLIGEAMPWMVILFSANLLASSEHKQISEISIGVIV
jgi:hypothetical protein